MVRKNNQCELLTLGKTRRVSLKLGRSQDEDLARCPYHQHYEETEGFILSLFY